jgi:hypothetical protein
MRPRTRTRERSATAGTIFEGLRPDRREWQVVGGSWPYVVEEWECHDFVEKTKSTLTGRTPPSDLDLRKTSITPPFLSYRFTSNWDGKLYDRFDDLPGYAPGIALETPPGGWQALEGSTNELTAKLLAGTNPFRYEVSIPIMISEFLEAGQLLKLASNNFFSLVGSGHLNWVFGWKPLLQDLKTLASITTAVEARIREFNSLLERGGISRRKHLQSSGDSFPPSIQSVFSNSMVEIHADVSYSFKTKVWGSVRWVPDRLDTVEIEKLTQFNKALLIALDLQVPDASTLWEAVPWTWLVDYFVNVGDVLQAIEASDLVIPTEICLMRHRTVTTTSHPKGGGVSNQFDLKVYSGTAGKVVHDIKLRNVVSADDVGDLLSFGFMSKSQATNLLALLASLTRFRK